MIEEIKLQHLDPDLFIREKTEEIKKTVGDGIDAKTASPSKLSFESLDQLAREIIRDVPGIVSVTYNIASKPPSTIEAI